MKLHAFDVETMGRRYRVFTRDKARKAIKRVVVHVDEDGLSIFPNQWRYVMPMSTTGLSDNDHIKAIHAAIRQRGFALVSMPPVHRDFFVYDKQLDSGDIRIYSRDKELTAFNRYWHLLEMSPKGDVFKGNPPEFVDEVKIPNSGVAKKMGLDFDILQEAGFEVHFIHQASETEAFRRYMERGLREHLTKEFAESGINIVDLKINSIRLRDKSDEQVEVQEKQSSGLDVTDKVVNIENKNVVNVHSPPVVSDTAERISHTFLDRWWVKALGLIAALLAIWTFFRDDIERYLSTLYAA